MRLVALVLLLAATTAQADAPSPDLVLSWREGEMSKDMSVWTTEITVTGTRLHYHRHYTGRDPGTKPVDLDGAVKDPKKVAAAIAALDALPATKPPAQSDSNYAESCLHRGKTVRCAVRGQEREMKALAAIRDALVDGIKLPLL